MLTKRAAEARADVGGWIACGPRWVQAQRQPRRVDRSSVVDLVGACKKAVSASRKATSGRGVTETAVVTLLSGAAWTTPVVASRKTLITVNLTDHLPTQCPVLKRSESALARRDLMVRSRPDSAT